MEEISNKTVLLLLDPELTRTPSFCGFTDVLLRRSPKNPLVFSSPI